MTQINYKYCVFTYTDEKFDLNEILDILNYELQDENLNVDKNQLFTYLNKDHPIDKEFIDFVNNNFIDIYSYMTKNNLNFDQNKFFETLWLSINNNIEVLITDDILEYINLNENENENYINLSNQEKYIKFLFENQLSFEEINYKNKKCKNYIEIQNYIDEINSDEINENKTWLLISLKNFLKSIDLLNQNKNSEIKNFIHVLQELKIDYDEYLYVNQPLLTIFSFMQNQNMILCDNENFYNLWTSLENKTEILITNNLLVFMGFLNKSDARENFTHVRNHNQHNYILYLKKNNILFKQINYEDKKAKNYSEIQNYIKRANPHTLHSKRWLILSIDDFKESLMMLNNKNGKIVKKYYLQLEKIFYAYNDYVKTYESKKKEYNLKQEFKKELKEKNLELEKSKKKNLRINNFLNNVEIRSRKLEWIYIASTDVYQANGIYKIGSTERLHKRIQTYQTGRVENFYYVKVFKCYYSKDLDYHIQRLLKQFKYQKHAEIYHGIHISDLIEIVEFLVNNYDASIEYINNFVKEKLENSLEKEILIMKPLYIKSIEYTIDNEKEVVNIDNENTNIVRETFFNFLETLENNSTVTKNELIQNLNLNMNKNSLWKEIKNISSWINSKTAIEYNNKKFFIFYK